MKMLDLGRNDCLDDMKADFTQLHQQKLMSLVLGVTGCRFCIMLSLQENLVLWSKMVSVITAISP